MVPLEGCHGQIPQGGLPPVRLEPLDVVEQAIRASVRVRNTDRSITSHSMGANKLSAMGVLAMGGPCLGGEPLRA